MRFIFSMLLVLSLTACELQYDGKDWHLNKSENVIDVPNLNFVWPAVETLPLSQVDYENHTVTLNGEVLNLGFFLDDILANERGFQIWNLNQNDTLNIWISGCELGQFSYHFEDWPFEPPMGVRTFVARDSTIIRAGNSVYLKGLFLDIPEAALSVQTQDVGSGNWDYVSGRCQNSTIGGYDDWRLPSMEELYVLYSAQARIGGFVQDYYWSEQSADIYHHYSIHFKDGYLSASNGNHNGRCVRNL